MFFDTVKLGFGHNLVMGHAPNELPLKAISEIIKEDRKALESFGLFDSASPNFATYYPDVTVENLKPKDGEFIQPVYRALSEVVVHKSWNPIDFGKKGVLKASMGLLVGQTVYPNHEAIMGNQLGSVMEVSWEEATTQQGIKIPAGFNARLKIDAKTNPGIARGILMDPPSVHSTSVTVSFEWVKSHENLSEQEFFQKLGSYDKDGQLIRRIANRVKNYSEISFVPHGADPFAQKKNDKGELNNPVYANTVYNSATNPTIKKESKLFFFDYKTDLVSNSDEETILEKFNNNKPEETMNRQFLIALAATLGIAEADVNADDSAALTQVQDALTAAVANHTTAQASLTEAQTQVTTLQAEVDRLKPIETELTALKAANLNVTELQDFKNTTLTALRDAAKANYTKLSGDKALPSILTMLSNADYATVTSLNEQYTVQLEEKYPATCTECGSHKVSRASHQKPDNAEGGEGNKTEKFSLDALKDRKKVESTKSLGALSFFNATPAAE